MHDREPAPTAGRSVAMLITRASLVVAILSLACSNGPSSADCRAGEVWFEGRCAEVCVDVCTAPGTCCREGVCLPCQGSGEPPLITRVDGTGTPDAQPGYAAHRLRDRVVVTGEYLADAEFTLRGTAPVTPLYALARCAPGTDLQVELALPALAVGGRFVLSAQNQSGQCNADLEILKGEPGTLEASGAQIVASINDALTNDPGLSIVRTLSPAAGDLRYVNAEGDTMTGELIVQASVGVGTDAPAAGLEVHPTGRVALTGLVTAGSGWTEINGSGTAFQSELAPGDTIVVGATTYTVATVDSDTHLTLTGGTSEGFVDAQAFVLADILRLVDGGGQEALRVDRRGALQVSGDFACSGCVASAELADGGVASQDIADGTILGADLADGAVSTAQLAAGAVTNAKLSCSCGTCFVFQTNVNQASSGQACGTQCTRSERLCTPNGWIYLYNCSTSSCA